APGPFPEEGRSCQGRLDRVRSRPSRLLRYRTPLGPRAGDCACEARRHANVGRRDRRHERFACRTSLTHRFSPTSSRTGVPPAPLRVFVPSVNGGSMLIEALRTLAEQTVPAECVLVDNGSTDGSVGRVRRELPEIRIVELGSNLGFGTAINEGVRRHPANLLVFANNDVLYEPRFLECLLDSGGRGDATVAGVLSAHDDPGTIDSAGVIVDMTLLAFDYLHGHGLDEAMVAQPPLGPTGAAALVPLSAFRSVGRCADRIFAYLEAVDLLFIEGLRRRAAGRRMPWLAARPSAVAGSPSTSTSHDQSRRHEPAE